jgi:hypothetical protein
MAQKPDDIAHWISGDCDVVRKAGDKKGKVGK